MCSMINFFLIFPRMPMYKRRYIYMRLNIGEKLMANHFLSHYTKYNPKNIFRNQFLPYLTFLSSSLFIFFYCPYAYSGSEPDEGTA